MPRKAVKKSEPKKEEEKAPKKEPLLARIRRHRIAILILLVILGLGALAYVYRSLIIAATVNGEPVFRYTLLTTAEQVAGPQVLDQLVTEKIIEQEARERGIEVTQEDLDNAFNELKEQYSAQGVDIQSLMDQNNVTREQLEQDVLRPQVLQEKLIESEGIVVTDEEVDKFFEENEDLLPEDPAELEATQGNVKESLRSQKVQQFLQQLRSDANVDYYVGQ